MVDNERNALFDRWDDLSHDNRTTIIVFGIIAFTIIVVAMLFFLCQVLMRAGI